jgi:hypothetical protein
MGNFGMRTIKRTVVITTILLFSCRSQERKSIIKFESGKAVAKNIDSPLELSKARIFYELFTVQNPKKSNPVKIDTLITKFDSLQVRLWIIGGLDGYRRLYQINLASENTAGYCIQMQPDSNYSQGIGSLEFLRGPVPLYIRNVRKASLDGNSLSTA